MRRLVASRSVHRVISALLLILAQAAAVPAADCNSNGTEDTEDIESGFSEDCNGDGTPDECQGVPVSIGRIDAGVPVPTVPQVVIPADLNGDGVTDLVVGSRDIRRGGFVSVLLGAGPRDFVAAGEYAAGQRLYWLAAADVDADGDVDVVTADSEELLVFRNACSGSLVGPTSYPAAERTRFVELADLDADGFPEIVSSSLVLDTLSVRRNRGDGTFEDPVDHAVGDYPSALVVGDFDGDGNQDVITADRDSATLSLLRGSGGGHLGAATQLGAGGTRPVFLASADLDGDGDLDLAVARSVSVSVLLNDGGGSFEDPVVWGESGNRIALADFDADGDVDLAAVRRASPTGVVVRINDGSAGFGVTRGFQMDRSPRSLAALDLDRDRYADVAVVTTSPGVASVLWSGEKGSLTAVRSATIPLSGCADARGCRPHSGALADIDGDGDLDIIGCNTHPGSFSIALNDGRGEMTFSGSRAFGGEHPQSVAVGDLDDDGDTDAVTVDNLDHRLYVHENDGEGGLVRQGLVPVGQGPINVRLGDLDGDGDLDAVSANEGANTVSVLFNDGSARFSPGPRRDYPVRSRPKSVALGDLDGDGTLDVAVANSGEAQVSWLRNDGTGVLSRVDLALGGIPNHVIAADVDGDGDLDLVTADTNARTCTVFLGSGKGRFGAPVAFTAGHSPYSVSAVDYNLDGDLDLITGSETSSDVAIMLGSGDGTFGSPERVAGGTGLRFALPGDLDGDGDFDIVTTNREGQSFTVLYNSSASAEIEFRESICTTADFFELSSRLARQGPVERLVKFLLPARDDPSLLPVVFQNTELFDHHERFLTTVFSERFPTLTTAQYDRLVGRRRSRDYFAGSVSRLWVDGEPIYGFDVYVNFSDRAELLELAEVRTIFSKLQQVFRLETLTYAPITPVAIERASGWVDAGLPVYLGGRPTAATFEAYTRGIAVGRVRLLTAAELEESSDRGGLSFQDILVLEEAPRDIEGVVAAVLTGQPQNELSHIGVRLAARGTPNAYTAGALESLASWEGDLVRLEVLSTAITVEEATAEEAEAFWESRRRVPSDAISIDEEHETLDTLEEIDLSGDVSTPESRFGGKASNFARLQGILEPPFDEYRAPGFAIPVRYYQEFLRSNSILSFERDLALVTLEEYLEELFDDPGFQTDPEVRFEALERLRARMRADEMVVSPELVSRLAGRIEEVFGSTTDRVRFRSSSNAEDLLEFSGAGLYRSLSACAADKLDEDDSGPSLCELAETDERGIVRALRGVWASLWNSRAFEEREFAGIPQDRVAMALLVTRTFVAEQANGVAFTGNPVNPFDDRYVIAVQTGETSVVNPDPAILAEKNLLEVVDGEVVRITRARNSSILPPGRVVLSDERLRELGRLLWHIDHEFPLELGDRDRDDVLMDVEFKIDADDQLAVKQVRPFVRNVTTGPAPTFVLEIPEETFACGQFARVDRDPRRELELKSRLRLVAGSLTLPTTAGEFSADLIAELVIGTEQNVARPLGPGVFRVDDLPSGGGETTYRFSFEQRFSLADGATVVISMSLLDFRAVEAEPVERTRTFESRLLVDEIVLLGTLRESGAAGEDQRESLLVYASCGYEELPLWDVQVELEGGDTLHLLERFRPTENARGTGPAALVSAGLLLAGAAREVNDYWSLVYAAAPHNENVRYLVVVDPPLQGKGVAAPVHAVGLVAPDPHAEIAAEATYFGSDFEVLARPEVVSFDRELIRSSVVRRFLRGDVHPDGVVNVTDGIALLEFFFRQGGPLVCPKSADVDDNGRLNVSDVVAVLGYLCAGRGPLPQPGPGCGVDRTADELLCEEYAPCD